MRFDRPFKELIIACFMDFVRLFMPELHAMIDPASIEFLDKEVFTDLVSEERSEADVVVKVKVLGEDAYFLIHVENQATPEPAFAERMFRYFAKLYGTHHLPVYPVAVFSWTKPVREQPDTFRVAFPDREVLRFRYRAIQLNHMRWRDYLRSDNPVAAALMTRMNVETKDRARVKLEALKNIGLLGLNPAVTQVAGWFVDNTMPLDEREQREFDERLEAEAMREKEVVMEMTTSWERKGREEGRREGEQEGRREGLREGREALAEAVLVFLRRQVGDLNAAREERVHALSIPALKQLSQALLDFRSADDLDTWLAGL